MKYYRYYDNEGILLACSVNKDRIVDYIKNINFKYEDDRIDAEFLSRIFHNIMSHSSWWLLINENEYHSLQMEYL